MRYAALTHPTSIPPLVSNWAWKKSKPQKLCHPERSRRAVSRSCSPHPKSLSHRERNVLVPCLRRGMQTGGSASIVKQEAEPPEARSQALPGNEVSLRQQGVTSKIIAKSLSQRERNFIRLPIRTPVFTWRGFAAPSENWGSIQQQIPNFRIFPSPALPLFLPGAFPVLRGSALPVAFAVLHPRSP